MAADAGSGKGYNGSPATSLWVLHAALLITQLGLAGGTTCNKFVLNTGTSPLLILFYRNCLALACLIPIALFSERKIRPKASLTILAPSITVLGAMGAATQLLMMYGLTLSSASFGAVIPITAPVLVFFISAVFRLEEVNIKKRDGQAAVLGIATAVGGGILMSVYRGRAIVGKAVGSPDEAMEHDGILTLGAEWQAGLSLLFLSGLLMAVYVTIQVPILRRYSAPISVSAYSFLSSTILSGMVGLVSFPSASEWAMILDVKMFFGILYLGVIGTGMSMSLQAWTIHRAGPLLLSSYYPVQAVSTALMAYLFLNDTIYLGSILGTLIIINGLFLITWSRAKARQDAMESSLTSPPRDPENVTPEDEVPLLQDRKAVNPVKMEESKLRHYMSM